MSISPHLGRQQRVGIPQGAISYRDCGSGSPIVFVHGVGVNGDLWRQVVPRLAGSHRCITPDLPWGSHSIPLKPDADPGDEAVAPRHFACPVVEGVLERAT